MSEGASGDRVPLDADAEWVLLCEGFHDRAFLAGMFESAFHIAPLREQRFGRSRVTTIGNFGYVNRAQALVRVVPCEGQRTAQGVIAQARRYLAGRETEPLRGLVLVLDEDLAKTDKAEDARAAATRARERLLRVAEQFGGAAVTSGLANQVDLTDGTRLFAIAWACDDAPSPSLPPVQCLERLIAGALSDVHPVRAAQVTQWLASRASPPRDAAAVNKAFTWSHMAGWYADRGCDGFLKSLWADSTLAAALSTRLQQSGSWDVIEKIVNEP